MKELILLLEDSTSLECSNEEKTIDDSHTQGIQNVQH